MAGTKRAQLEVVLLGVVQTVQDMILLSSPCGYGDIAK